MSDLFSKVNTVNSQKTMASFIQDLAEDYKINKDEWVNTDLESFLSALSRWVGDMDGYYKNTEQPYNEHDIGWRNIADMLIASTVYE